MCQPDQEVGVASGREDLLEWAQDLRQRGDARLAGSAGAGRQAGQPHFLLRHERSPPLLQDALIIRRVSHDALPGGRAKGRPYVATSKVGV